MMDREWRAILNRYGQQVLVRPGAGGEEVPLRAFLQPVLDRSRGQEVPSPLGLRREDRMLYLGPGDQPLTAGESRVTWGKRDYDVQSAHRVGDSHWWALLRPRDKEEL